MAEYRTDLSPEEYNDQAVIFASIRQVLRVFDIDLDNGTFAFADRQRGCAAYRIKDVCTAAYYAGKSAYQPIEQREAILFERLQGKEICASQSPTMQL